MMGLTSNNNSAVKKRYFVIEWIKKNNIPTGRGMKRFLKLCPVCKHYSIKVHRWTFIVNGVSCSIRMGNCCYIFTRRHRNKFRWQLLFRELPRRTRTTNYREQPSKTSDSSSRSAIDCHETFENCLQHWREQDIEEFKALRRHRSENSRRGGLVKFTQEALKQEKLCTFCRIHVIEKLMEIALLNQQMGNVIVEDQGKKMEVCNCVANK